VNADVEGVFEAGGSFGHLNGYKYQLKAHTISNPAVISKGMKGREKEFEIERKFACGGVSHLESSSTGVISRLRSSTAFSHTGAISTC
jgi:hypothetical protein